jgi:hypothetical protein
MLRLTRLPRARTTVLAWLCALCLPPFWRRAAHASSSTFRFPPSTSYQLLARRSPD